MHQKPLRLHQIAALRAGAVFALCAGLLAAAAAGPIVLQDGAHPTGETTDTSKLVTLEAEPLPLEDPSAWPAAKSAAGTKPEPAKTTEQASLPPSAGPVRLERPGATPTAAQGNAEPNADLSLHNAIKESVRPVYDQLVESGAVEALHDLKADLGLNKNQWSDQEKADAPTKGPGQWDAANAQEPAQQPPRTAAQAQLDREMATLMREKLIDQITPWLIGLVVLYVVGYLAKLLYGYIRWKSAKRNERRIARAQRHTSRRIRSGSRATASAPATPPVTAESQETV